MSSSEHHDGQSLVHFGEWLEVVPDAMIVMDRRGLITHLNAEAESMFGYSRAELTGQPVDLLVPAPLRGRHDEHRAAYIAQPRRRPMGMGLDLLALRKDGSEFPVEISLSPVSSGEDLLVTAAVRDVSQRVKAERALAATNRELEAFTYSVSHDLRAPIRHIDGFARLLAESLLPHMDERSAHYVHRILDATAQVGQLIDDLLRLARIGQSEVAAVPTSLDAVLREAVAVLQPDLASRAIEWNLQPLPVVECDPGLVKIVFTNLLSNAVKYTRHSSPAIIEIRAETTNGRPVMSISDNGVGFDMQYAGQLFGPFQRLHRRDEFEGTGIGLATVQRIVRKHGGDIWASAAPNSGATFSFSLGPARADGAVALEET